MENFNLQSHLDAIYNSFPEATHQPIIGITANYTGEDATLRDRYYMQVVKAGGTPVIIPPVNDKNAIINTLEHIDGLLLSGGGDYNPLWAGEEPQPQLQGINSKRDLPELLITQLAFNRQIPILGICRGIQTLAMVFGGHVTQHIQEKKETTPTKSGRNANKGVTTNVIPLIKHSQNADRQEPSHSVTITKGSILSKIYQSEKIYVNSFHHQAVDQTGERFKVTALSPDGVIEAIESSEYKPIIGVQWHPEWLEEDGRKLFKWLIDQANNFHVAKRLHKRILTLDTHCDTPMFFSQDINFSHRDPRILVD